MEKKAKKEKGESVKTPSKNSEKIATHGRIFQGVVIRKFNKRITIELERTVYIPKYERFTKKKTRIHARLPDENAHDVHIGDLVKVQECRPLSKMIHFVFTEKISGDEE